MHLSKAIQGNVVSLKDTQNTYKENVLKITLLMSSVVNSNLPPMKITPPDFNQFSESLVKAKASALSWTNGPLSHLLSVPESVRDYNSIITPILQDALTQTGILKDDPNNQSAKRILDFDLKNLSSQMNLIVSSISASVTSIKQFRSTLPSMANELSSIADRAIEDAKADEKQIQELQTKIDNLNKEIDNLTAGIVGLGILDAAAIGIGALGFAMPFPANVAIWIFSGAAIAAATTVIVVDGIKISSDKDQIAAAQGRMDEYTADVSTLKILSNNFDRLSNEVDQIQDNVQAVLNAWLNLESDINAAILDITTATADSKSDSYSKVYDDLEQAVQDWNTTYTEAGSLYIELNANTANISVGMSDSEVKKAVSEGETMGVIKYLNSAA